MINWFGNWSTRTIKAPSHRNEFPIFDDESRFNNVVKTKLAGVSQQSLAIIKEMQPFRKDDKWSALKTVHSLCNIDKHRSVILPLYMLDRCSVTYRGGGDPSMKPLVRSSHSSMKPELRKDMIAYSVQPPDAIFEINLFVDMKLEGSDGLDPEKYLDMKSNEQQVILVLKDCMSTVRAAIDCLSGEIQKHPLFGRRPPLYGVKSVNISMEGLVDALSGELKQQYLRDLYGLPDLTIDTE